MNAISNVLLLAALLIPAGCSTNFDFHSECPPGVPYDDGHIGPNKEPDPCHLQDPKCAGECVPKAPVDWFGPDLLWMGNGPEMAACPEQAPGDGFIGHADPTGLPNDCPTCACSLPTGKCVLPEHVDVFNAQKCPGAPVMSWDAPPDWDGTCTTQDAIPKGQLCNGVPCVQSIQIESPKIEASCTPTPPPPPYPADKSDWGQVARACVGAPGAGCPDKKDVCVPTSAPPPPGFHQCISRPGDDQHCTVEYPDRHVFYEGSMDSRACTQCTCSDPIGGECDVQFTTYEGGQCGPPSLDYPFKSTDPSPCIDLSPGKMLAGKTAKVTSLDLGKCTPSGGDPTGKLEPLNPTTFCCR